MSRQKGVQAGGTDAGGRRWWTFIETSGPRLRNVRATTQIEMDRVVAMLNGRVNKEKGLGFRV
eukprot:352687-Chlamydomonas_euryale.AAC.3